MRNFKDIIIEKLKVSKNSTYWEWEPTSESVDALEFARVLREYVRLHGKYDLVELLGKDNLPSYTDNKQVYHITAVKTQPGNLNIYTICLSIEEIDHEGESPTYKESSTSSFRVFKNYLGSSIKPNTNRTEISDYRGQAILMKIYHDMKDELKL